MKVVTHTRVSRTCHPSVGRNARKWLAGLVLATIAVCGCTSATASTPEVAPPKSNFGDSLSLAISLGTALAAGDKSVTADFRLTNDGSAVFEGCFGQAWGVSVIVDGHDAGHIVRADYPKCEEKLTLLPRQTIVWSKKVPLTNLRAGLAKVTGWVRIVDPAACDPRRGCRDVSVASRLMTIAVPER
jgi:hypothetical protein